MQLPLEIHSLILIYVLEMNMYDTYESPNEVGPTNIDIFPILSVFIMFCNPNGISLFRKLFRYFFIII